MRKAVVATQRAVMTQPTPHPHPSPEGEGLTLVYLRSDDFAELSIHLPREKGRDEGHQPLMKSRARTLRRKSTDAEIQLWQHLRNRRLLNCKFRRQVPIGNYIVDFFCEDAQLIVELDGGQHMEQERYDQARSAWLVAQGFRVVRFWNNDAMKNMDGVLESLTLTLSQGRGNEISP